MRPSTEEALKLALNHSPRDYFSQKHQRVQFRMPSTEHGLSSVVNQVPEGHKDPTQVSSLSSTLASAIPSRSILRGTSGALELCGHDQWLHQYYLSPKHGSKRDLADSVFGLKRNLSSSPKDGRHKKRRKWLPPLGPKTPEGKGPNSYDWVDTNPEAFAMLASASSHVGPYSTPGSAKRGTSG